MIAFITPFMGGENLSAKRKEKNHVEVTKIYDYIPQNDIEYLHLASRH